METTIYRKENQNPNVNRKILRAVIEGSKRPETIHFRCFLTEKNWKNWDNERLDQIETFVCRKRRRNESHDSESDKKRNERKENAECELQGRNIRCTLDSDQFLSFWSTRLLTKQNFYDEEREKRRGRERLERGVFSLSKREVSERKCWFLR